MTTTGSKPGLKRAKPLIVLVLLGLSATTLFTVTAQDKAADNKHRVFSIHDTDKDGFLSEQEYLQFVQKRLQRLHSQGIKPGRLAAPLSFTELDKNTDLKIDEDEMVNGIHQQRQKRKRYRHRYRSGKS